MMDVFMETITPERARKYLQHNKSNRPLRRSHVNRLRSDIENDRWQVTHQGIAFNKDGDLVDGQHRLSAIAESGKAVTMMVTRGVQSDSAMGLLVDVGATRSSADVLNMPRSAVDPCSFLQTVIEGRGGHSKASAAPYVDAFGLHAQQIYDAAPGTRKGVSSAAVRAAAIAACFLDGNIQHSCKVYERLFYLNFEEMSKIEHAFVRGMHNGTISSARKHDLFTRALAVFSPRCKDLSRLFASADRYDAAREALSNYMKSVSA